MARQPRSGGPGRQTGASMYSVATQLAQGRKNIQPPRLPITHGGSLCYNHHVPRRQGLTVKQEEQVPNTDAETTYTTQTHASYTNHGQHLCKKHKQSLKYIHRPLSADWVPDYEEKEIHLKPGQYITRGNPCIHYVDEFSTYCLYGNEVRLYNDNLKNLRKLIKSSRTPNCYYVCHMTKTFATPGKRMYFKVPFSRTSLFPHMNASNELPVSNGDGTVSVNVRFIRGVDNRATITRNWSSFFRQAKMKKGRVYAFAFKCSGNGLCMIVYPI